jgi:hypothetical protein
METMMAIQSVDQEQIRARLDAVMEELMAIRQVIVTASETLVQDEGQTERLLGCLGPEPIANYDYDLEWQRFDL